MADTATAKSQVEQLIEKRLAEIEEQLQPFAALVDERRRLQDALAALRADAPPGALPELPQSQTPRSQPPPKRARRSRSAKGKRAPRGSNLQAIVDFVSANPGSTAGEIASGTGISRGVVYSATSRMSASGKLERRPKSDGQVGYQVAKAA
jgi:hypothetical protein